MVRTIPGLLLLLLIVPALALPPSAALAGDETYMVTAEKLNMRKGPGGSYDIIKVLHEGDAVVLIGSQAGWYQIRTTEGALGWVKSRHLSPLGSVTTQSKKKKKAKQKSKKKKKKRNRNVAYNPSRAVVLKAGAAMPFLAALTPMVEAELWYRVRHKKHNDFYFTGALGYSYMEANAAFGGEPDLRGHWLPLTAGGAVTFNYWSEAVPYVGAGLSLNYYNFSAQEDEIDLDIEDEDVHGVGLGGRGSFGVQVPLHPGAVVVEDQLHLNQVEDGTELSNVIFLGYRLVF